MFDRFESFIPVIMFAVFALIAIIAESNKRRAAKKKRETVSSEPPVRKAKKSRKTPPASSPLKETSVLREIPPHSAQNTRNQEKNEKFPANLSRYPVLQRAFVLQEIFGQPKGLKD
jgi:hypothetical protein